METLYQVLAILAAGLIIWLLYTRIKHQPEAFSRANFSKSFRTLGILGIILILFVTLLVFLAR
ncbi:MAG: hypothetical protein Q8L68_00940 [Methylococcales bacterium]|nr:hypothetical protein [Methylococcales bacterium]